MHWIDLYVAKAKCKRVNVKMCSRKYPDPPHSSGNSSFVLYFLFKIVVFETVLPLGISHDPPQDGYGYFFSGTAQCTGKMIY